MKKQLSEMKYNEEGTIKKIDENLKRQIAGMGIREGKKVKMMTRQPVKGPVVIEIDKATTSLGLGLADKIIVETEEK